MITIPRSAQKLLEHAPLRISIAASGAGAGLQKALWDVPGISSVFMEALFPYSMDATNQFLRFQPEQYCSAKTAVEMAMECYYRAYQPGGPKAIGVGLSASVSSLKAHRGEHRVFAAWFSDHGCRVYEKVLEKSSDPAGVGRLTDGFIADSIGLQAVLEAVGETMSLAHVQTPYDGMELASEAFWGNPFFGKNGERYPMPFRVEALFPGSFNPPHAGHFGMAKAFQSATKLDPTFHITAVSPHKPALSVVDMLQRAKLLHGFNRAFSTLDPLYLDKAKKFPGCPILLGADSLERMVDPKWGVSPEELSREFSRLGTQFYVPEVRAIGGQEVRARELALPPGLIVNLIPGRWDISSSELRASASS